MVLTQDMRDFARARSSSSTRSSAWSRSAASRFAERAIVDRRAAVRDRTGRRTLIVGAGRTGRSLMRELRETAGERVIGFVDDNPRLRRRSVHGRPGARHDRRARPRSSSGTEPDIVLVTIPDARARRLDAVVAACAEAGVDVPLRPARGRPRPARRPRRRRRMNSTGDDGLGRVARGAARGARSSTALLAAIPVVGLALAVARVLRRRGVDAEDAVGLHRRARVDAALALDRGRPATRRGAASRSTSSRSTRT